MNPHFTALEAAYQLRYYLSFKTKYLKPTLAVIETQDLAHQVLADVLLGATVITCSRRASTKITCVCW